MPKLILLIPTLLLPLFIISSALASPSDELGSASQQIGDLEARSQELDANYQQALMNLVAVDSEVNRYSTEIASTNQRQAEIQASIVEEQKRLAEVQAQLTERQSILEKRLRGTYKSNDVGYLEVVMGAGDFSDFLNRVDMINTIADEDRNIVESVQEAKKTEEEKIASLAEKQAELAGLVNQLSTAQSNLVSAQASQQSVVNSLQNEKLANDGQLSQLQAQAASIEARMSQLQSGSSGGGGGDAPYAPPSGGSGNFTATAYCLGGTTASGMPVGRGIIAVDPSVIPLGSRVHVSGYGDAIAADTGGAINGNRIDVWLPCGEAYEWGVRTVTVTY